MTEIRAGLAQKQFFVPTDRLTSKSAYFQTIAESPTSVTVKPSTNIARQPSIRGPFFFPDLDEFAMALFTT